MFDAIMFAHEEIKKIVAFIKDMCPIGKPKFEYARASFDEELYERSKHGDSTRSDTLSTPTINVREERMNVIRNEIIEPSGPRTQCRALLEEFCTTSEIVVREWLLQSKRVDGRGMDEVRPLAAESTAPPRSRLRHVTRDRPRFSQRQPSHNLRPAKA
jgi:polyribonucleotide nucleotidyltransferase